MFMVLDLNRDRAVEAGRKTVVVSSLTRKKKVYSITIIVNERIWNIC